MWQQRGVHCAGLYLTRPSRLLAMVGSVTHDLEPVQFWCPFFWGRMVIAINSTCCIHLLLLCCSAVASCSATVHWHTDMMTPKEKGCNAWIEKNSRGISAEVRAGDTHWYWIRWHWLHLGTLGSPTRGLHPSARPTGFQKNRKPMMSWAQFC